jgi:tetratricopeptide (TPR) repeat protein
VIPRLLGAALLVAVPAGAWAQGPPAGDGARVAALSGVGRYEQAIAVARDANLAPALAELLRMTGRWDEAGQVLTAARAQHRADSLLVMLQLGLLYQERGQRDAAFREFDRLIDAYNAGGRLSSRELTAVAVAVDHLSVTDPRLARDALRAFDEATAADSGNIAARLGVGALFLERYNGTEAHAAFAAAAGRDSLDARVLLGLARTAQFAGTGPVQELVRRSLERNPRFEDAHVFLAELLADVDDYEGARQEIAAALEVNPRSLPALSMRAGVAWLAGDSGAFARARDTVLALNPRYAPLYVTAAELAGHHRLYDDAAAFARKAVALDSLAWRGYTLLGVNELRRGAMDSGRAHLERAFAGDPYDVWTKNTLDLLDTLETYPVRAAGRFRIVADPADIDVLVPYVAPLAEAAYASFAKRYGVTPPGPIRVELFHRHADFSVRTMGLVGLGALGVSFGPVVAMDAPAARPRGEFNWGSTLWHELAHTFHMAASAYRVPRWFTEGLAVYEERLARPGWGDDVSPAFLQAYRDGRLLPVGRLNDGFVRPAYPEQLGYSYYEASLVCEMIAGAHGFPALVAMLRAFGAGRDTPAAFREVLHTDPDAFEPAFRAWLEHRFATELGALAAHGSGAAGPAPPRSPAAIEESARKNPGDFRAQLAMGQLLVQRGRGADAIPYLERAQRLFPEYAEDDGPYRLLAAVDRERGDLRAAATELSAMTAINERSYDARIELADVRLALGDSAGAADALDDVMFVDPTEAAVHRRLAELAQALHRPALAVREWRAFVALNPPDPVEAYYRLAKAQLAAGDREAARRAVLRALERAPGYEPALGLLLELKEGGRP